MVSPSQTPEWQDAEQTLLSNRIDWLSTQLAGNPYLMGEKFSVADGYLFTILSWAKPLSFDLSKWPTLEQYIARVGARPKVVEAMKAEGLVKCPADDPPECRPA